MKLTTGLTAIIILVILNSCSSTKPAQFPFDDYNYTLTQLNLGIAFPPSSSTEERTFSIDHMNTLGLDLLRIDQTWDLREPVNNTYNWQPLTDKLNTFTTAGKKIFLTMELKSFPTWTNSLTSTDLQTQYRQYVHDLLGLYGDKIEYIQFGNEWNWEIDDYFGGDEDKFIALANILYDEVHNLTGNRPKVVLGSLSIGALRALAYSQGRITNIYFGSTPLYSDAELATAGSVVPRLNNIVKNVNFKVIDLHFYDDYWNWAIYMDAISQLISDNGKDPSNYSVIASEFGGPHPTLENNDASARAIGLIRYIQTLDDIGVSNAIYFKLIEESDAQIAHPNSFLIDDNLNKTLRYEVMRRFGN